MFYSFVYRPSTLFIVSHQQKYCTGPMWIYKLYAIFNSFTQLPFIASCVINKAFYNVAKCHTNLIIVITPNCRHRMQLINCIFNVSPNTGRCMHISKPIYPKHYSGVIMGATASQITSLTIAYLTVYSGADQRKHQSSASLIFVRGIHVIYICVHMYIYIYIHRQNSNIRRTKSQNLNVSPLVMQFDQSIEASF